MAGNLKFYLITDLHYYDKSLGITGKAYEELSNADQKCLAESGAIIDAYFDKIVEDKEVDTVLIAGDVTYNGAKESHLGLLPKLNRFKEAGKRVFLITATHDYYVEGNRTGCPERCDGDVLGRATVTSREELAEMYYEFGPNEAISRHEESHSYSVQLCEGYRLLCLNDDGDRVFCGYSEDQLRWIDEQITAAHEAGDYIFAMTHHPVLPPTPIYPIMSKRDMLGDCEKTAEFLADRGVKFVFTGHAHMMNVGKITTKAGNDFYDVNTCSPVGYPSAMRKVTMTESEVQIESVVIDDFDWDRKGKTAEEYLKDSFSYMLNDVLYSAAYDIDHLANDLACGFSMTPEQIYKMKVPLGIIGKALQKLTLGGLGKLLFISKSIDKKIRDMKVKDFILMLIQSTFHGDEPYTPDTAEYKAFAAITGRVKSVLKHKNGTESACEIIDLVTTKVLFDEPPADWNVVLSK